MWDTPVSLEKLWRCFSGELPKFLAVLCHLLSLLSLVPQVGVREGHRDAEQDASPARGSFVSLVSPQPTAQPWQQGTPCLAHFEASPFQKQQQGIVE